MRLHRIVRIKTITVGHYPVHLVEIVNRSKGQRRLAAQFDGRSIPLSYVRQWVEDQEHLTLAKEST